MGWLPMVVYLFLKDTFFIMYLYIFKPLRWFRICAYTGAAFTTTFYISTAVAMLIITYLVVENPGLDIDLNM